MRSFSPFSTGEGERLRDFLSGSISLDLLREPRSDFTFEWLFDRDLRSAEWERDFGERERDLDLWDPEWDLRLREHDLLSPDFLSDLERECRRLLLLRERDL